MQLRFWMRAAEIRDCPIQGIAYDVLDHDDPKLAYENRFCLFEAAWNLTDEAVHALADLRDRAPFCRELKSARPAATQHDPHVVFELFERIAYSRLLAGQTIRGPADAAGNRDLMKNLEQIPIQVSFEFGSA